ncbi:MAG: hypothetical protein WA982_14355 [Rubrobacteraceae bacterium]
MIRDSKQGLLQRRKVNSPVVSREMLVLGLVTLGIMGGPFLLTMLPLLFVYSLGFVGTDVAKVVFWSCGFTSYVVLLPLATGLALRSRERKQEIAGEMMAFFSSRIVDLYSVSKLSPFSEDPRTAEAFAIYSQAERESEENVGNPLQVRETIERGVSLVDELLEDHRGT